MKKGEILILGSTGMFGTAMEKVCKQKGIKYTSLSHQDLDISDKNKLEEKIAEYDPEVIINSVAMMGILPCEQNPQKAFEINALSVLQLAKICRSKHITLVHISSNAIFDGKKEELYYEEDFPNPQNIYGLSKYAGEVCVKNNLDSYYIIRFPKLFGPRRNNTLGFTDKMMDQMRKGLELKIAEDRIETFTYTFHAAQKTLFLLKNKPFGLYHVANKGSTSCYDFVSKLAKKLGYNGKITRAKNSDFPSLAPNPLRIELGSSQIELMSSWKEALEEYIELEQVKL